jgi:hypothetical protein
MSWFSRLRNWQQDDANGIGIRSDYHDEEDNNFAAGINLSLNIAGLNSPTSNIPMAGFKLTGAGDGTAAQDYATVKQIQTQASTYAVDAVGTDAYAITLSPAIAAYTAGMVIKFKAATANTGAATLNVNGLGAQTILKIGGATLANNDINTNQIVEVIYDGTNFYMVSQLHGAVGQNGQSIYALDTASTDSYTIALSPSLPAYITGMVISFKAVTANTGAATLDINSLGATSIKKYGDVALDNNDIKAGQIVQVCYDGTNFQMLSPPSTFAISPATQAEMEAGSSLTAYVTPGRQQYHPGACKGWCVAQLDGTSAAAYNVTSVSDNGSGDASVNWTTAFSSASVCYVATLKSDSVLITTVANTTTSASICRLFSKTPGGVLTDPSTFSISAFGDFS